MIRLNVEDYCQSCLDFNPEVTRPMRYSTLDGDLRLQSDTIIECEHRNRCAGIKRYLERQMNADNNWHQSVDIATPFGSYLDDFWDTDNDWDEGSVQKYLLMLSFLSI